MNEFTIKEIITLATPLILVFIAGGIALFNLRQSINLQARNKWKEDFRNHVSDYLETLLKYIFTAAEYRKGIERKKPVKEEMMQLKIFSGELVGRFSKIELMLNSENKDSEKLKKYAEAHNLYLSLILDGKDKPEDDFLVDSFFTSFTSVAKQIYEKR